MKLASKLSLILGLSALAPVAHAAGLPQLDHTWFANQILWLVVSFIVLYTIVSLFIAPTIAGILKTRESSIADAIREAERAKAEAELTRSGYEAGENSARTKAQELLAKVQAEISRNASDALTTLDHDLDRKAKQAEARIVDAQAKAAASMQQATSDLAAAMASKLLGRSVSKEEVTATSSIDKLKKAS